MDTPPLERGLSFTLSWSSNGSVRRASASLGAALRVALALSLCAGCYELGRWHARLDAQSEGKPDASRVVIVERGDNKPARAETVGSAPGGPNGTSDVITPLNVRDPTALVMGPGASEPPSPPPPPSVSEKEIPDVAPPAKVYKKAKDIKPNQRF
jgi:hypothetical protein